MAKRTKFTFESNVDKIEAKIREKPAKVLNVIGQNIVRETKANIKATKSIRRGLLAATIGYWARKKEKDLQIGFKMSIIENPSGAGPGIVGDMITFKEPEPILPVVKQNKDEIVRLIGAALDEIRKEKS
jgi:hypothetical protein